MNARQRHEGDDDALSAGDVERLLAGTELDAEAGPELTVLHEFLTHARQSGNDPELAQMDRVVAAFGAALTANRAADTSSENRLKAISRQTVAIIGIAISGSLGTAFATGAVGVPFAASPPNSHAPETTQHPLRPTDSSLTIPASGTAADDTATNTTFPSPVTTAAESRLISSAAVATGQPEPEPVVEVTAEPPSATAPGQTGLSPSATAPGQTGPSATAPGQTGLSPSATAPGQTGIGPSATAPGQTGISPSPTAPGTTVETPSNNAPGRTNPSVTAPGQTGISPSVTAPGQTGISPSVTAPGQTGISPSVTAPGQTGISPSVTAPGQTGISPSVTAPGQIDRTPSATAPGQTGQTPSVTAPGQTDRTGRGGGVPASAAPGDGDGDED